jgi:spermidine synthase
MLLLAAGSGLAALIYEIVWFQLLEQVLGSTAVSLAVLLSVFMGGMCVGSWVLPRFVSPTYHPLRVYAVIELAIGVFGVLVLHVAPLAGSVYTSWAGDGLRGFLLRGGVAAVVLLAPAMLMGATLPALARQAPGGSALGFLYTANLAGAVAGCLISGFYLLRKYDVATASYAAAAVNVIVAAGGAGFSLQRRLQSPPSLPPGLKPRLQAEACSTIHIAIALSGLTSLAAEVIWTRNLGLLFGASVYTLSIILAVFLVGLGLGSAFGSLLSRIARERVTFGWVQLLLAGAIAWPAYCINAALPYWPTDPSISSSIGFNFQLDLARAFWALIPATFLWGASFPLALALAGDTRDKGRLMASMYSWNTLGAIIGALGASLLLIPAIGSQHAQQVLIALAIISGLILLPRRRIALPFAAFYAAGLIYCVAPVSKLLIAYGRYAATWVGKSDIVYAAEGINSSVAVARFPNGAMTYHVAGKVQASNVPRDMRLQRMLGHLTTLTNPHPRSVVVIGCGAGITAGAVSIDPRVERLTIVEIEPLAPRAAAIYFSEPNFDVLRNPKVQVRIDDGRHYILTSRERFDGITVDPLDPWVKGAANLYTKEFVQAMKEHLNPGGTVTMYIQLFETTPDAVKSAIATFLEVFPNGTLWGNPYEGRGHDLVMLGQAEPLRIDLDETEKRFGYYDAESRIPESLAQIGVNSPEELFATYAGSRGDLSVWLQGAKINQDRNLRMQYLAGLGLNRDESAAIYSSLLAHRRFPEDLFVSTEGRLDSLRLMMREY